MAKGGKSAAKKSVTGKTAAGKHAKQDLRAGARTVAVCVMATCWAGLSITISQVVVFLIMRAFLGERLLETPLWTAIYDAAMYLLAGALTIGAPWLVLKKWKATREEMGLMGWPTWTDIGLAPVGLIIYFILAYLVTLVFALFPWFEEDQAQDVGFNAIYSNSDLLIAFIALCVIAPIAEEAIFRGWLYGKLRARMGLVGAILLTSLLFGAMHGQWNVAVNVFAMSVVLCLQRELTGTIYSGILLHMIKNTIAFYMLYILV